MNDMDLLAELQNGYIDSNGLVTPSKNSAPSQNGILFSSIYHMITGEPDFMPAIQKCFKKKGLLMRTPQDTGGPQEFDDYLGLAVSCLALGNTEIPRQVLWYGITHLFWFDTGGSFNWSNFWSGSLSTKWDMIKKEGGKFLGRYPHVWCMMFAAAFPKQYKWIYPALWIATKLQKPAPIAEIGSSALQLQWVWHTGMELLKNDVVGLEFAKAMGAYMIVQPEGFPPIHDIVATYYQAGHPYIGAVK